MSLYPTKSYPITKGLSEFEILKASHKFLREDAPPDKTWEDKLAEKYYESLYREFALCDLKHYKSGNFALRWRTESEVLSGAGESTCGNTRCKYHYSSTPSLSLSRKKKKEPQLTTLELPFAYIEHGEAKSALVKVVLCPRCVKKLMWKRMKDKERTQAGMEAVASGDVGVQVDGGQGGGGEGVSESEDSEDDIEKVDRKGKGKERDKDRDKDRRPGSGRESRTGSDDREGREREESVSRPHKFEERTRKKRHRDVNDLSADHEGDGHKSRRRSSRSRSPRRRH
ncbi:hypothetical protein P691DRAFT_719673 [Macrolepiota fuliginosa MF-IS2]|uniref:Protein FRA10AC1 n=1 Tax=Macrolepiota fuliginosa MF-IS2 TaxID=1400762 RepID=A0A9P5XN00_9AGAR|nr:hypothetical protein P691DRAFT_719673 [Macrolepiota fuliginosa MF-IS2]